MLIFHMLHLQQDLEGNLRESKQSRTVRGLSRSVSHGTGLTLENVVIRAESEGAVIQFYDKNDDLIATHDYSKVKIFHCPKTAMQVKQLLIVVLIGCRITR